MAYGLAVLVMSWRMLASLNATHRELRNMGRAGPAVFRAVTAILMHLVLSRLLGWWLP